MKILHQCSLAVGAESDRYQPSPKGVPACAAGSLFIIAACGGVLYAHGITEIQTTEQAAEALREAGLDVHDLFCVVDREEGGRERRPVEIAAVRRGEALSVFFDAPPTATSVMTEGWFVGRWVEMHRGPATAARKTGASAP